MKIPNDTSSEAFLLARMLISIDAVNEAIGSLRSEDFSDPVHGVIFSAMSVLYAQDCEIEPISVASVMQTKFPEFADTAYLFGLRMHQFSGSGVTHFIKSIKEASRLKQFAYIGRQLAVDATSEAKNSEEIYGDCIKKIESVFAEDYEKSSLTLKETLEQEYAESGKDIIGYAEQQMENHRKGIRVLRGLPTGYGKIDDILSGFCKGHYIIVGARPGAGKTTLILNFMYNLIQKKISVGFFSLEMTKAEAATKIACIEARIESENLERGKINHEEFQRFVVAVKTLSAAPLIIDDTESLKASNLISRAKRMVSANKIEILFIDYIGEVRGDGKFISKQEEIQSVSKALRAMAKKLRIPVVCIAQLNRDNEKEARNPRKSDLRESGQIEADAHSILLLHRPSTDDSMQNPGLVKMFIVKNRFGKEGVVHFHFKGEEGKFYEMDYTVREDKTDE